MVFHSVVLLGITLCVPTAAWAADQERGIAAKIALLGSENQTERAAAVKALVALGKPAGPVLVQALSDARNDVRSLAAEALRGLLAADPANAPNCHEKAFWQARVDQLKPGMTVDEALQTLLPELSAKERRERLCLAFAGSGPATHIYRMDDYWSVCFYSIGFQDERLAPSLTPRLSQCVRHVWVNPPAEFAGTWVTWYTNGQKADERHYDHGKLTEKSQASDSSGKVHPAIRKKEQ